MSAIECSECSVVLLFRHNLCQSPQKHSKQCCNELKTPQVQAVYSFMLFLKMSLPILMQSNSFIFVLLQKESNT